MEKETEKTEAEKKEYILFNNAKIDFFTEMIYLYQDKKCVGDIELYELDKYKFSGEGKLEVDITDDVRPGDEDKEEE